MSSTPASEAPAAPLPTTREFRAGAHQALLVSNGRDTFYVTEIQRAIAGLGSPLQRFLPPASYTVSARVAGSTGGGARVAFAVEGDAATARPLRSPGSALSGALALPRAEIEAFATAVAQFLSTASSLTPLQQQCRREFRLPDPVREPDAYWVIGSGFDRRLIILWGCERFARTSVPLDRVVEHLRGCEMAWPDKQQLALQLAQAKDEPLSAFLGLPAKDGTGLVVRGSTIPSKALKPFAHFGRAAYQSFETAARAFIAKAADPATSLLEAELRREFRLPSLASMPERFHRAGAQLVIEASPADRAKCAPPAPLSDEVPAEQPPLTVQLAQRVKFQGTRYVIAGAAAAVLLLGGLAAVLFGPDREPPAFQELKPVGPSTLVATFSEPMVWKSEDAVAFVNDTARVAKLSAEPAAPQKVIIQTTEPMIDGEEYRVVLSEAFTDRAGHPLVRLDEKFTYFDTASPQLARERGISAGGLSNRDLVLTFTKPVSEDSLSPSAFVVQSKSGGELGKRIPIAGAKLDLDTKDGTRVIVTADEDFESRRQYVLSLRGVSDRAKRPNRVVAEEVPFEYKDILPPTVRTVVATGATYAVQLEFSKKLEPSVACNEANYAIAAMSEGKSNLRFVAGSTQLDESGRVVTLRLERSTLSAGKHHLMIYAAADQQGNKLERPIERDFEFGDAPQRGSPRIVSITGDDRSPLLTLQFDRGLAPASVTRERFSILTGDRVMSELLVTQAAPTSEDTRRVALTLSRPPVAGTEYYVRTEGLEDVFGASQTAPEAKAFRADGVGRSQTNLILSRPPVLVTANHVRIHFDNVISRPTAENVDNYIVNPAGAIVQQIRYELQTDPAGAPVSCSVTLVFATPFTGPVSVGAKNLQIEGDMLGNLYRVRPRPAQVAAP